MQNHRVAIAVILGMLGIPATGSAQVPEDQRFTRDDAEKLSSGIALKLVCGETPPAFPSPGTGAARFTLGEDGRLLIDKTGEMNTFAFESKTLAFGLIQVTSQNGHREVKVACGQIESKKTYKIALKEVPAGAVVLMSLYGQVSDDELYLEEHRVRVLVQIQQTERDAVHAVKVLQSFATSMRAVLISPTNSELAMAKRLAGEVAAELYSVQQYRCRPGASGLLVPAICDEVLGLAMLVGSLQSILVNMPPAVPERIAALKSHKAAEAVEALQVKPAITPGARNQHCQRIEKLRWLYTKDIERLVARATVPIVPVLMSETYGGKASNKERMSTRNKMGLIVHGVPVAEKTSFGTHEGARVTLEIADIAGSFLAAALRAVPPRSVLKGIVPVWSQKFFLGKTKCRGRDKTDCLRIQRMAIASLLCELDPEPEQLRMAIDASLVPRSKTDARSFAFGPISRDQVTHIAICEGDACTAKEDDKAVKTRVKLVPSKARTWTLLAEIAFGAGYSDASDNYGFSTLSEPQFKPVLGPQGPDQVFEMQQNADPRDVISTALLVSRHCTDDTLVGVGPTLLVGASGTAFTQWNFRIGHQLGKGFYVTVGLGVRWVPFPEDYELGQRVSVPRSMAAAPPVRTYFSPVPQVNLGIAIDLAAVGGVAGSVYKAIGGK